MVMFVRLHEFMCSTVGRSLQKSAGTRSGHRELQVLRPEPRSSAKGISEPSPQPQSKNVLENIKILNLTVYYRVMMTKMTTVT